MAKKIGSFIQKLAIIAMGFLIAVNTYLLSRRFLFNERLPKLFGFCHVVVVSGSMQPSINVGDLLILREEGSYRAGEVVTYRYGEKLVTHRIAFLGDGYFVAKGDKNGAYDAPAKIDSVEGKVFLIVPHLGRVSLFLRTRAGIFFAVLTSFLLVLGAQITDREKPAH